MSPSPTPQPNSLLKTILEPLLADFQYWFARARSRLERQDFAGLLSADQQADLLARVQAAESEVQAAQLLFRATGEQVGVEMRQMAAWHALVAECWQVAQRWQATQREANGEIE